MLAKIFGRAAAGDNGVAHPAVAGLRLDSVRDARGFQLGVLLDESATEATIAARVDDAATMTHEAVAAWTGKVGTEETVVATCASRSVEDETATAVLWVSVAAAGKAERKDSSEFLTRLARFAPVLYDSADALGMDAKPLSAHELEAWTTVQLVGEDRPKAFPPRAGEVSEGPAAVVADGKVTVSFEVVMEGEGGDEAASGVMEKMVFHGSVLSASTNGAVAVRFGMWSRIAARAHHSARCVGVVSVIAADSATAEDAAWALIARLDVADRLRVRRLWYRQAMGAGASLGAGVMGWRRLEVAA